MKYKALISDFDGTLFSSDGRIPNENTEAIGEFVASGGKFALCTGRMTASAIRMLEKFPFNQLIAAYNGCEVWDNVNKKTLFSTGIQTELARKIIEFAHEGNCFLSSIAARKYSRRKSRNFPRFTPIPAKLK